MPTPPPIPLPKPINQKKAAAQAASGLPTVTIDDREHRVHTDLVNDLELLGITLNVERMDFGDYAFTGCYVSKVDRHVSVGIEVSSVSDLVGKLNNDRLAFQISNMLLRYDVTVLLITSPIQCDKDGYVTLPRMPKACTFDRLMDVLGAAQAHGAIVQYASGPLDVAARIHQIVKYWSKDENSHKYFRNRDAKREVVLPVGADVDKRVANLMTLPGVGEERAKDALKLYGSLNNIYLAGEAGLSLIPGWSTITAKKVMQFINTPILNGAFPPSEK